MRKMHNWKVWGVLGLLLALVLAVGYGREVVPVSPPPTPELILALDLARATFSMPPTHRLLSAEQPFGGWFIPVKGFSDVMNTPPSKDTLVGIMAVGPKLAVIYFRVEREVGYLTVTLPFEPDIGIWATARARWVVFGKEVAGENQFLLTYPPTRAKPWWWPDEIRVRHHPGCEWEIKIIWK